MEGYRRRLYGVSSRFDVAVAGAQPVYQHRGSVTERRVARVSQWRPQQYPKRGNERVGIQ